MPHHAPLIAAIVAGIVLATVLGAIANRFRLSPLVGYLLAGVLVGPHTPGFVADQELIPQLAEIGVILLMFGVGLHFSLKDLLSVRAHRGARRAGPDRLRHRARPRPRHVARLGHRRPAWCSAWRCRSRAPWCCCARSQERGSLETERGRIAVGWLIVEDLAMVLVLVLLPALRWNRCAATALTTPAAARNDCADARQSRRLRRADAGGRPPGDSENARPHRAQRIARAVHG
jgi:CPA2 family monovalent cation:H+ antiporter-2